MEGIPALSIDFVGHIHRYIAPPKLEATPNLFIKLKS